MQLDSLGKNPDDEREMLRMTHRLMVDIKVKLNETGCEYDPCGRVQAPVADAF
jgi:hypothetical protein